MFFRFLTLLVLTFGGMAFAATYTVKTGDTLYSIAKAHNTTPSRLLQLNKLAGPIQPGQVLQLPDTQNPATQTSNTQNILPLPSGTNLFAHPSTSSVRRTAYRSLGAPYRWGNSGPNSFDCSGFVRHVMRQHGLNLPHSSELQSRLGRFVARQNLTEGDLVFFATRGRGVVSHVAIYIGNNQIIHAENERTGVVVSSLAGTYYSSRYLFARRVL